MGHKLNLSNGIPLLQSHYQLKSWERSPFRGPVLIWSLGLADTTCCWEGTVAVVAQDALLHSTGPLVAATRRLPWLDYKNLGNNCMQPRVSVLFCCLLIITLVMLLSTPPPVKCLGFFIAKTDLQTSMTRLSFFKTECLTRTCIAAVLIYNIHDYMVFIWLEIGSVFIKSKAKIMPSNIPVGYFHCPG